MTATMTFVGGRCKKCRTKGFVLTINKLCTKCAGEAAVLRLRREQKKNRKGRGR